VIRHIISQANHKLSEIRKKNPSAGGLVVASSVEHATKILNILRNEFKVMAQIATYRENEPTTIIKDFKESSVPWIVSVGMISEGTNIPRLQICCHLTRIKTELNFRQILGRILRMTNAPNQDAYLFMPAEKTLIEYACRLAEDIPHENSVVRFEYSDTSICIDGFDETLSDIPDHQHDSGYQIDITEGCAAQNIDGSSHQNQPSLLTQTYEATLNVFGQFQQEILAMNTSPFD
jgi:superfamily II DNA or RNA helicase